MLTTKIQFLFSSLLLYPFPPQLSGPRNILGGKGLSGVTGKVPTDDGGEQDARAEAQTQQHCLVLSAHFTSTATGLGRLCADELKTEGQEESAMRTKHSMRSIVVTFRRSVYRHGWPSTHKRVCPTSEFLLLFLLSFHVTVSRFAGAYKGQKGMRSNNTLPFPSGTCAMFSCLHCVMIRPRYV